MLSPVFEFLFLTLKAVGMWSVEKHGQRSRRCWRKLDLAVDANTNLIVACVRTEQDEDDPSQLRPLLAQIPPEIEITQVTADGAHDEERTYQTILARQSDIAMVIPPRIGAVLSQADGAIVTQRDAMY